MPRPKLTKLRPRMSSQTVSRWSARAALLVLLVVAGSLLVGFVRMTWTLHQIKQEQVQEQVKLAEAQAVAAERKGEAEFRESDVYAEQAAREQLGFARDGDTVILPTVVIPVTPTPAPTSQAAVPSAAPAAIEDERVTNYDRWWQALFPDPGTQP